MLVPFQVYNMPKKPSAQWHKLTVFIRDNGQEWHDTFPKESLYIFFFENVEEELGQLYKGIIGHTLHHFSDISNVLPSIGNKRKVKLISL